MIKIKPQTLKGFRDFLPETMNIRKKVIEIFTDVFQKYGFEPLETPALEYGETLLGKYGTEAEKLMYLFEDQGKRKVGLRYDLTVPTCRVLSQYPNLTMPFKRYQIQPAWRAEKPQKGRYREFTQCDIDIFGSPSPLADAEIIAIIFETIKAVGFKKFVIKINSRSVLFKLMDEAGISEPNRLNIIQTLDKLDKKTKTEIEEELDKKGLKKETIDKIFGLLSKAKPDAFLNEVIKLSQTLGVLESYCQFTPTLARGLDYYTGPIYETSVTEPKIGSITGGGRYDKLVETFTGKDIPATGTTIGLDRTVDVIEELNLWPDFKPEVAKALITVFSPELTQKSAIIANLLRLAGVSTEIFTNPEARLDKQIKYADRKEIPYVVIIGPDEAKSDKVTLKNLQTGKQEILTSSKLVSVLK